MIYPFYLIHLFRLTHLLRLFHLILLFRLIRLIQGAEISSIHSLGRGGRREDFTKGPEKGDTVLSVDTVYQTGCYCT